MQITITHNLAQLLPKLGAIGQQQMPFAVARALTFTARESMEAVQASMPGRFTLRRNWVVKGIRYRPASKTKLTSYVYTKDEFMARQETGGIKTGKPGGGNFSSANVPQNSGTRSRFAGIGRVAVPTQNVLRTKQDIIRKSDLPSGQGNKAFVIGNNGNQQLLVRRFQKGKRAGLKVLYVLKKQTYVKPRFGMRDTVINTVKTRYADIFEKSITDAMANPK